MSRRILVGVPFKNDLLEWCDLDADALTGYLSNVVASRPMRAEFLYRCTEELVLTHGQGFAGCDDESPLLPGHRFEALACFTNTLRLAVSVPGLAYVEGFAMTEASQQYAVHHAWCGALGPAGWLVRDPTWGCRKDFVYFGIPLQPSWVSNELDRRYAERLILQVNSGRVGGGSPLKSTAILDDWEYDFATLRVGLPDQAFFDST